MLKTRLLNTSFISVGDILRESAIRNKNLAKVLNSGALVDDEVVNDAVLHCLEDRIQAQGKGTNQKLTILDGFPRTDRQASLLDKWPTSLQPKFAVQLEVPENICITKIIGRRKCILCHKSLNVNGVLDENGFDMPPMLPNYDTDEDCRILNCNPEVDWKKREDDDTPETVKLRMDIYRRETEPLLQYWEDKGKLIRFVPYKGVKEVDKLASLIETRLEKSV